MSESTKKNSGETTAQQKLAEFEAAQLTRRAALAKFGLRSVAAVLGVLTIDDLARKVGQQMERQAGNNQVASAVAKEFQAAGIAFADDTGASDNPCGPFTGKDCSGCCNSFKIQTLTCCTNYNTDAANCLRDHPLGNVDPEYQLCLTNAQTQRGRCKDTAAANRSKCELCNNLSCPGECKQGCPEG
jgi:hypothetical protein